MAESRHIVRQLKQLRPFVEAATNAKLRRDRMFSLCLRASFAKAFEFADSAFSQSSGDQVLYQVAALRGICEDIIFLRFGSTLPIADRENLIKGLMLVELGEGIAQQAKFFSAFRPNQPVISQGISPTNLKKAKQEVRDIWRAHGWPNLNRGINPPTRQIAARVDPGMLDIVYDYLFRLTSSMVHFSPHILFRSGWGKTMKEMKFSSKNMAPYYVAFAQIYGAFLLCLYFEFFGRYLRPGASNRAIVDRLREDIVMQNRWPEMVTFEEMNLDVPENGLIEFVGRFVVAQQRKRGFIAVSA